MDSRSAATLSLRARLTEAAESIGVAQTEIDPQWVGRGSGFEAYAARSASELLAKAEQKVKRAVQWLDRIEKAERDNG